jgi:hypothetical protein
MVVVVEMIGLTVVWRDELNFFGAIGDEYECFWHRS